MTKLYRMRYIGFMFEITEYTDEAGESPFSGWMRQVNDAQALARIDARIGRLVEGLFGDCKPVGEGVWELKVNWGPGYRVYYARAGRRVILILCAGDKRGQRTDIKRAIRLWQDWKRRTK